MNHQINHRKRQASLECQWNNKFGEDESLKNRQYSRTARNQPEREATTAVQGLALVVIYVCIIHSSFSSGLMRHVHRIITTDGFTECLSG